MLKLVASTLFVALVASPSAAQSTGDFHWSGSVDRGKTLEIRGVSGDIRAEPATGNTVDVVAVKHARRGDPATVSVQVVQHDGNVTICAVYPEWSGRSRADRGRDTPASPAPSECRSDTRVDGDHRDNDIMVDFTVKVPAGVRFVAANINGGIDAQSLKSDADLRTVNGRITVSTSGLASANTVNGSIDATIGAGDSKEPLEFRTVNGSITVRLPKDLDANVRARTVNGGLQSDFPVTIDGASHGRNQRISGTIGKGGRDIRLDTVNGSIRLQSVTRQ